VIYVTANTKGGVGKSTTAINLACQLHYLGRDFKIVEIDNSNSSMIFSNSQILKNRGMTIKTDEKAKAIGGIFFNLAKNPNMDYIVDIGGGDDFKQIIESLKELELQKRYLIPVTSDKKYLKNAENTFKVIDDPENTFFVLNRCYSDDFKQEFMYFFGNKKLGVKPVSVIFESAKYITVPFSNFYQIAEDNEETLLDLALVSMKKNEMEITKEFMEISGDDEGQFIALWEHYERSKEVAKVFMRIYQNMQPLFTEENPDS